jgi:GDPmannose 4,6-dehydratase
MWLMLQQDEPGDFVVATGGPLRRTRRAGLAEVGIDNWRDYVAGQIPGRPAEVDLLIGDPSKAATCSAGNPGRLPGAIR